MKIAYLANRKFCAGKIPLKCKLCICCSTDLKIGEDAQTGTNSHQIIAHSKTIIWIVP